MNHLRQLYPGRAEPASAARLDVPPRFAPLRIAVQADPLPRTSPAQAAALEVATPTYPSQTTRADPRAANPRPQTVRPSDPAPPGQAAHVAQAARPGAFDRPRPVSPVGDPISPAAAATRPSDSLPTAHADGAPIVREPAAVAMPVAPTPRTMTSAPTVSPLREEALRERAQPPRAEPAPIVHVTIDRIDVRLPAAPAPLPTARRPRPASGVPPLADYLRGRSGGGT